MAKRGGNEDISEVLGRIDRKLTQVLAMLSGKPPGVVELMPYGEPSLKVEQLLKSSEHLRKTVLVLGRFERATSQTIAETTGRARALESGYLNQLVKMGLTRKERAGRRIYFSISTRKPRKQRKR